MSDEVIIDGVNVAECEYYNKGTCDNENNHNIGCGQYDNCNYKQLKRKLRKQKLQELVDITQEYNLYDTTEEYSRR